MCLQQPDKDRPLGRILGSEPTLYKITRKYPWKNLSIRGPKEEGIAIVQTFSMSYTYNASVCQWKVMQSCTVNHAYKCFYQNINSILEEYTHLCFFETKEVNHLFSLFTAETHLESQVQAFLSNPTASQNQNCTFYSLVNVSALSHTNLCWKSKHHVST